MPSVRLTLPTALAGLCLLAAGCGQNVCLVQDVPPPVFGPRSGPRAAPMPGHPSGTQGAVTAIDWVPRAPERKWRFIIVHHSATPTGNAAKFDADHRAQGWDELGYDFVIGNGTLSGDGQIEIGPRWVKQTTGAHCKVAGHPEYNELGIGICLVGNFNETRPTEAQMRSLAWLIRGLMERYHIPKSRVLGHGMLKPTDCPGKQFDFKDLYSRL
jgi:hypothetical protein